MALRLDTSTATIAVDNAGAKSGVHVGKELVLLHGTRNANLAVADMATGGKVNKGHSIALTGKVFLEADASDFDIGDFQFGMIQVANVMFEEVGYAGRMDNEGSIAINLRAGYTKNPSLDALHDGQTSIEDSIFDPNAVTAKRVTTPRIGFQIEYLFGDHPHWKLPRTFENKRVPATNFISSVRRDEGFVTYFVARENKTAPVQFLSRVGWHVIWHATFKWSVAKMQPTASVITSHFGLGQVLLGPPADPNDDHFLVAKARVGPTTNAQDNQASTDAENRNTKVCKQEPTRPASLPSDFFH